MLLVKHIAHAGPTTLRLGVALLSFFLISLPFSAENQDSTQVRTGTRKKGLAYTHTSYKTFLMAESPLPSVHSKLQAR